MMFAYRRLNINIKRERQFIYPKHLFLLKYALGACCNLILQMRHCVDYGGLIVKWISSKFDVPFTTLV